MGLSVICAARVGLLLPADSTSVELLARTKLGYDNVLLALASGAAGALSLTIRLPSALTGDVMVAVTLLPPATTFGYMIGIGELRLAVGAATLLAVNIVCRSACLPEGFKPRTWIERRAAHQSTKISLSDRLEFARGSNWCCLLGTRIDK